MLLDKYAALTTQDIRSYRYTKETLYIKHFHHWERHLKMCLRNLISSLSRFACTNGLIFLKFIIYQLSTNQSNYITSIRHTYI